MHGRSRILFFPLVFHEKVTKNQSKKCEKQGPTEKTRKVGSWGRLFLAKCGTFDVFGVPGAFPGEALGRILGNKFRGEKIDEKKVWKALASAGDADPGQDPPAGFLKHDSARLRSPGCRWAGGLFALRVTRQGHLEVGSFEALSL